MRTVRAMPQWSKAGWAAERRENKFISIMWLIWTHIFLFPDLLFSLSHFNPYPIGVGPEVRRKRVHSKNQKNIIDFFSVVIFRFDVITWQRVRCAEEERGNRFDVTAWRCRIRNREKEKKCMENWIVIVCRLDSRMRHISPRTATATIRFTAVTILFVIVRPERQKPAHFSNRQGKWIKLWTHSRERQAENGKLNTKPKCHR